MEKKLQQESENWLKQQSIISRYWLNISKLLGIFMGLLIISQAWILAHILYCIIQNIPCKTSTSLLIMLLLIFILRFLVTWSYEKVGFYAGQYIRRAIRHQILDFLQQSGPFWIQRKPVGDWTILILEQIDNIHDYYAHYLPQMTLSFFIPLMIVIATFFVNWVAALIQLITAPLILFFMIIIGTGATEANQRNFKALSRLSSYFLDCLRGMDTLRIFNYGKAEIKNINQASQNFRQCTMEVLRLVFLSSGVLEFFSAFSIALISVYFVFSYLGELHFGHYDIPVTLLTGFLALILTPEFFRPLKDLGIFYHAKAQALSAADNLRAIFEEKPLISIKHNGISLNFNESILIEAKNLCIFSLEGKLLAGPLNFKILNGQRVALVGFSGSGKSSLLNTLIGFLPYTGSLQVNNIELRELNLDEWRKILSWIGQNPQLLITTLRDNILIKRNSIKKNKLHSILKYTRINEFLNLLPQGLNTVIGDQNFGLSAGQVQRVAIARALINPCKLLLLDEPTANLDMHNEKYIVDILNEVSLAQSTLMITHRLNNITEWDDIWVMENGHIVEQGNYNTLYARRGIFFMLLTQYDKRWRI